MTFLAIRQKSTGFLVPSGGKGMRGHTHQEPSPIRPPRLFICQQTAKRALRCYIEGKWIESYSKSYDGELDYSGPEPKSNTARNKEDFEVVKVEVRVRQGGEKT